MCGSTKFDDEDESCCDECCGGDSCVDCSIPCCEEFNQDYYNQYNPEDEVNDIKINMVVNKTKLLN